MYENLQKEKVQIGDVIYIETSTGAVKRVGRCDAYATEFDLEAEEYVPIPKGEPHKKKEIVQFFIIVNQINEINIFYFISLCIC